MTMTNEWEIVEEAIHLVSRGVSVKDAAKRLRVDREWLNVRVTSHKEPMTAAEVKARHRERAGYKDNALDQRAQHGTA